jgi:hypothetical protein
MSKRLSCRGASRAAKAARFAALAAGVAASAGAYALTDGERIDRLEQQVSQLGASMADRPAGDEGLPLHGFMDVGARTASNGGLKGFGLGNVDFYLIPRIGERIKGLIELNFEVSDAGELDTDLERMQIGYVFSDAWTVWAGRFHSPWGYWNTAYHHGAQIQTSITRPRFLEFEDRGGIIPAHSVGLWGTGAVRAGGGKFTYDLYTGNSQRVVLDAGAPGSGVLDPNLGSSTNHNAMAGFNLGYLFSAVGDGLKLGVHGYTAKIDDDGVPVNSTQVRFLGAYGVYLANDWEILAEHYRFGNHDLSGASGTHPSWAGYAQIGRLFGRWTPYARFEKALLDQSDAYFSQQESGQSYGRSVAGVRYDLDPRAALKLEANRTRLLDRTSSSFNELRAQFAIRF